MPININGAASAGLVNTFNQIRERIEEQQERLATGFKINSAKDDPAGLAILNNLQGQVRGNNVAIQNSVSGISALQIAEGGLGQVNDSLTKVRELSIQAQNGILTESDRAALQSQADALLEGIQGSLGQATFNGKSLLTDDGQLRLQTGPNTGDVQQISTFDVAGQLTESGVFSLDISSPTALDTIDQASGFVNNIAAEFGAAQNRLDSTINQLQESTINQSAAASRIGDTDFAKTISERTNALIQQEVSIAIQAQANASQGLVMQLLGRQF